MTNEQEKLVTANIGYVVTLARQYKSEVLTTDDLVSEGCIGMLKAAVKFDAGRGKPFVTFAAPFIRRAIESAILRSDTQADVRSTDESLPAGSHNNYTLLNVLEDVNAPRTDATIEAGTLSDELTSRIVLLDERQQAVVTRYYGIGTERQSMAEIGAALGLQRERVRQIRNQALRKIRKLKK